VHVICKHCAIYVRGFSTGRFWCLQGVLNQPPIDTEGQLYSSLLFHHMPRFRIYHGEAGVEDKGTREPQSNVDSTTFQTQDFQTPLQLPNPSPSITCSAFSPCIRVCM
jgi:hypothetical protein